MRPGTLTPPEPGHRRDRAQYRRNATSVPRCHEAASRGARAAMLTGGRRVRALETRNDFDQSETVEQRLDRLGEKQPARWIMKPTQSASRSTSSTSCDDTSTVHSRSRGTSSRAGGAAPREQRGSRETGERFVEHDQVRSVCERRQQRRFHSRSARRGLRARPGRPSPSEACSCAHSSASHEG